MAKKLLYRWNFDGIPEGAPWLTNLLPPAEFPSAPWVDKVVGSLLSIGVGVIRDPITLAGLFELLAEDIFNGNIDVLNKIATYFKIKEFYESTVKNRLDYERLHLFPIRNPESQYDYEDDEAFTRSRLQGPNPITIEKCTPETRQKLKVLDVDSEYEALREKVDGLMDEGKLFVVDHRLLADMTTTPVQSTEDLGFLSSIQGWEMKDRYLARGIALFEAIDDDLIPLRIIGIQLSQGEEATPIFTPEDQGGDEENANWLIAKACFEAADFIVHEVVSHLGFTHVVMEGLMVSLHRELPEEHPIYDLLHPHIEGTALINWGAQNLLIPPGAGVDRLQANDITESWTLVVEQVVERISKDFSPPADFARRGVTAEDLPGRYPYRDFGLKYWDAILTWVTEYLDLYYATDDDVDNDYELQAFVKEMIDKAAVTWFEELNEEGNTDKKGFLAKALATYIYTASVLHAAVNFPQKTSMSFVPATGVSMFKEIPTTKEPRTMEEYWETLPPMDIASEHVTITTLLGSIFHTRLGFYDATQFADERAKVPLAKFHVALEDIEAEMADVNEYLYYAWLSRGKGDKPAQNFAYKTILPDSIPQSINI